MKPLFFCAVLSVVLAGARSEGDYFLFVRQWDPTVCSVGKCSHSPGCRFTIHGLWPQYYNDTWPEFCTSEGFDPTLVADLEPVLRREWPSVFSNNAAFWKHEWRKHGTCAEALCPLLSDEHAFFFAVLALNKMYDLNIVMKDENITLETPHEQWWVEHTFEETFQHSLALHCYHEGHDKHKQVVPVFEVWMCFDKQLQPFDCPANVQRKCHGDVIFPALSPGNFDVDTYSSATGAAALSHHGSNSAAASGDDSCSQGSAGSAGSVLEALEELVTPGVRVLDAVDEFQQQRRQRVQASGA